MFDRPVTAVRGPEPGPPICIVFEYAHTQLTTVQRLERGFDNSFNNILLSELSLTITACANLRCPTVWENGCVTESVTRLSPRRLWLPVSTPPWDIRYSFKRTHYRHQLFKSTLASNRYRSAVSS